MDRTINAKQLRASLPEIVRRTRRGERFLVLYRSRPAFQVVPVDSDATSDSAPAETDSLYEADAVGKSRDGVPPGEYDRLIYGARR